MNAWRMFLGLLPLLGAVLWLADAQAAPPDKGFAPPKKGQILGGDWALLDAVEAQ